MKQLVQIIIAQITVAQEAGMEPYIGQLAVAWTLHNRALREGSLSDVCLRAAQFSAWNTDSPTRMNIDDLTDDQLSNALRAVLAAQFHQEPDPTSGAIFYLNVETVMRQSGKLPGWWEIDGDPASERKIGRHTFRRHR